MEDEGRQAPARASRRSFCKGMHEFLLRLLPRAPRFSSHSFDVSAASCVFVESFVESGDPAAELIDARPGLEQLNLLGRALLRPRLGRPCARPRGLAFRCLGQFLLEHLGDEAPPASSGAPHRASSLPSSIVAPAARSAHRSSDDERTARRAPCSGVKAGLEDGAQPVVVVLGDRIVAVVVALGAGDGHAVERRCSRS